MTRQAAAEQRSPVCSRCMRELGGIPAMQELGGWPRSAGQSCSLCGEAAPQLAPPPVRPPRQTVARFGGTCGSCRRPFAAGTAILVAAGSAPRHVTCPLRCPDCGQWIIGGADGCFDCRMRRQAAARQAAALTAATAASCNKCGAALASHAEWLARAAKQLAAGCAVAALACPPCDTATAASYAAKRRAEHDEAIAVSVADAQRALREYQAWGVRLAACLDGGHQWSAGEAVEGAICARCGAAVRLGYTEGGDGYRPGNEEGVAYLYVASWAGAPARAHRPWDLYEDPETPQEAVAWNAMQAAIKAAMAPVEAERARIAALEHAAFMRRDAAQRARPVHDAPKAFDPALHGPGGWENRV